MFQKSSCQQCAYCASHLESHNQPKKPIRHQTNPTETHIYLSSSLWDVMTVCWWEKKLHLQWEKKRDREWLLPPQMKWLCGWMYMRVQAARSNEWEAGTEWEEESCFSETINTETHWKTVTLSWLPLFALFVERQFQVFRLIGKKRVCMRVSKCYVFVNLIAFWSINANLWWPTYKISFKHNKMY